MNGIMMIAMSLLICLYHVWLYFLALTYGITPASVIRPCFKVDKPLVNYILL